MKAESFRPSAAVSSGALKSRRLPRETAFIYLTLLPVYAVTATITLVPLVFAAYVSFHEWILTRSSTPASWVGFGNYLRVFQDPQSGRVFANTAFLMLAVAGGSTLLGLVAAFVVSANFTGRGLLRSLLLLPWAVPGVAAGIMWWWLFNSKFGILNYLLREAGIVKAPVVWLVDHAMWTVVLASVWKEMPLAALLFLGGLQAIGPELYEAAYVDGATGLQVLAYVVLPLLRNVAAVVLIFQTASAIKTFDLIFALTNGGPAGATTTLAVWTYQVAFRYWDFGRGSAIAFTAAGLIMAISVLYLRVLSRRSEVIAS